MTSDEALTVVKELMPRAAVPMHYDLFAENTEDPEPFVKGCLTLGIRSRTLNQGEELSISGLF